MNILDILSANAIKVPLEHTEKKSVIGELVDLLADNGAIDDPAPVKQAVWEREQQRTTGIGEGLAIPHGKSRTIDHLVMAIGRPGEPIDFAAVDKKPVQLVVLLVSPPDRTSDHIQALGKVSRLMADPAFRRAAYEAATSEALFELFRDAETQRV